MNLSTPPNPPTFLPTLDDHVAAFEDALAAGRRADLATFLPPADHPLYLDTLGELIRVELEHDWEQGQPRPLAEYRARFTDALADRDLFAGIAFEEYRLRRQAGEDPDPLDYARQFDLDTRDWPPKKSAVRSPQSAVPLLNSTPDPRPRTSDDSLLNVAHSYRAFRFQPASVDVESWVQSCPGGGDLARLFGDLHRADPHFADRFATGLASLPAVGDSFLGFRLLSELGRGAFGRVYLARQEDLAQRLVALKVAPDVGGESQTLAQLQHTHIVPIYSLHRAGPLQAVCMPYFGAITLADVLGDLSRRPSFPRLGSELLTQLTLRREIAEGKSTDRRSAAPASGGRQPPAGDSLPGGAHPPLAGIDSRPALAGAAQATLKRLQGLSYVEAVVWLGCCLADGLAHAHERGILHRDLKPANILLTDEGQPMLLDFNLAEDTKLRGNLSAAVIGGTVPYMAPEQLAAFRGDKCVVDERSDLFALGMILYELLTGLSPFPTPAPNKDVDRLVEAVRQSRQSPPIPIRSRNRLVTPAVWSILNRCLAADPTQRYASARELHEDLQRQLDSQPLRHAPELSIRERLGKQFRRSPRLLPRLIAGVAVLGLIVAGGAALLIHLEKQAEEARADLLDRTEQARLDHQKATTDILHAMFLLTVHDNPARKEEGAGLARQVLARYQVGQRDDWRERDSFALLAELDRQKLAGDLGELLFLLAREEKEKETALALLRQAEDCFGDQVPLPLWLKKASLVPEDEARKLREMVQNSPRIRVRDHTLAARVSMEGRRFHQAVKALDDAIKLDPQNLMAHFLLGVCHDALGEPDAAIASYRACLVAAPDFHGVFFNRGLAYFRRGKHSLALSDFDRALVARPDFADTYLNRGLTYQALNKLKEAEADFTRVLELKPELTRVLFLRARIRQARKDEKGAEADWREGLKRDPRDDQSWNARGQFLIGRNDLAGALACFEEGLKVNPTSLWCLKAKSYVLGHLQRRNAEALEVMNRIVQLHPDHPLGYSDRGILLARQGQREKAHADARRALSLDNSAELTYRVGCIYALTAPQFPADGNYALQLLHDALVRGFGASYLPDDDDLKPLHSHPEFPRLRALALSLKTPPASSKP